MQRHFLKATVIASLFAGVSFACSGANSNSGMNSDLGGGGTPGTGAATGTGGAPSGTGSTASSSGGTIGGSTGGTTTGGSSGTGGAVGSGGSTTECENAALTWKTAHKTNYTSYPDPGSEECVKYNGCMWAGQFAGCSGVKSEEWVASHNIAAMFPNFGTYELHDICIKSGDKVMIVTVYDTCADSDCSGCCTANKGDKDALIDLESYTNARWGLADGAIQWADLGPSANGCN